MAYGKVPPIVILGIPYAVMAAIAATLSAVATFTMAWLTYRLGNKTRDLAVETKGSVAAEVKLVDQGKDALMPVLRFEVFVYPPGYSVQINENQEINQQFLVVYQQPALAASYLIAVENVGSGPAFVRDVTTRDEVDVSTVYNSPLRTAIIGTGETKRFTLVGNLERGFPDAGQVSSMSLWYTDVYRRWHRSRIVLVYPVQPKPAVAPDKACVALCREFQSGIKDPGVAYDDPANEAYVQWREHGVLHPGSPVSHQWYELSAVTRLSGRIMPGCEATLSREFKILDMGFWLYQRDPVFTVQIDQNDPFVIARRMNDGKLEVVLKGAEEFRKQVLFGMVPFAPFGSQELPLDAWGLRNRMTDGQGFFTSFYNEIYTRARTIVVAGEPDDTQVQ